MGSMRVSSGGGFEARVREGRRCEEGRRHWGLIRCLGSRRRTRAGGVWRGILGLLLWLFVLRVGDL